MLRTFPLRRALRLSAHALVLASPNPSFAVAHFTGFSVAFALQQIENTHLAMDAFYLAEREGFEPSQGLSPL